MNPRQRRGTVLMALAVLGGLGVFALVSSYVADVRNQVEPLVPVLWVTEDVPVQQSIADSVVEERMVPQRWVPASALRNRSELEGLVTAMPVPAGSVLQDGMVSDRAELEIGQREIAILVDAETGVAGKVGPGDVVDIYATFEEDEREAARSEIVVAGARVIDVGSERLEAGQDDSGAFQESRVVPVTFALSVEESLVLTYVESFAVKVRLGLLAPGDDQPLTSSERRFQLSGSAPTSTAEDDS